MTELTAEKASRIAMQQLDSCEKFKQPRLQKILEYMEADYGKFKPTMRGRSAIPIPFFAKYVKEVKARVDESPIIKFKHKKDSHILLAHKIQSACDIDRSPSMGDWNRKDRMATSMAVYSGVGAFDYFAESSPDYKSNLETIDIFDLYFEPTGGNDLENHRYVGKGNIFKSKSEVEALAEEGTYNADVVKELLLQGDSAGYKELKTQYLNRYERFKALGLDMTSSENYIGEQFFPCAQWEMTYGGERYFLVFEMISGKPLRFEKLKDVFESNLYSLVAWQTHEDPHTLLSKSPADDMWPIAEWLRVQGNYFIDHSTKRLWGQKGYDPNFVPDPSQLEWYRPDQLTVMTSYQGKPISNGVYEFQTPDNTTATINIMQYFENLLASTAGVSPQDPSLQDQKVGVLFGNLQKVSAVLGIYGKSHNEAINKISQRYVWGLKENLTEPMAVKIMGERGVEWDELSKEELSGDTDFDIEVVGANVELEMSEARKKKQQDMLKVIVSDPDLKKEVNPKFVVEEGLRSAEFKEESIKRALDKEHYGSERVIAHASIAIEKILQGKEPEMYRGADIEFLRYIHEFNVEHNITPEKGLKLLAYARKHLQIVAHNMALKAKWKASQLAVQNAYQDVREPNGGGAPRTPLSMGRESEQAGMGGRGAPVGAVPSAGVAVAQS